MKNMMMFLSVFLFSTMAMAGFRAYQANQDLGIFSTIKCSTGMTCTKVGDKFQLVSTQLTAQTQVAATATTITAAQCGSTFYNSGAVEMDLPEASTVIGCRYTFVTLNAANFDVDPDAADQILVLTDAAGDKIRNATLGNTVTIQAVSASQWAVVGEKGTWSDAN